MQIINVKQGSPEWLAQRAGRITGSRMADVLALTKGKTKLCIVDPVSQEVVKPMRLGKGIEKRTAEAQKAGFEVKDMVVEPPRPQQARIDYTLQLAWERFARVPQITKSSMEMQWGKDCEDYGRFCYEARTGIRVQTVGFCMLESGFVGISPDGLVRDDGGIEIKSPFNGRFHMDRWIHGMEDEHMAQLQGAMWVTGRTWWDFVSFDPRVPKDKRIFIQTVYRNEEYISNLAQQCATVSKLADEIVYQVTGKDPAVSAKARNYEAEPVAVPEPPARLGLQTETRSGS